MKRITPPFPSVKTAWAAASTTLKVLIVLALFSGPAVALSWSLFGGTISNPDQAEPVDVEVCNGLSTVRTTLLFNEDGNATIDLSLPTGLSYVAGTVMTENSNAGLTVTEDSGDPSSPQFSVSGVSDGQNIEISYAVEANCAAAEESNDIGVSLTVNSTSTGVISVDVLAADLSILSHNAVTADYGAVVTVPVSVENGGFGSIAPWSFYIVENGGTTLSLSLAGTATVIPPASTNGDTVFYTIDEALLNTAGLSDEFDNGEAINFDREVEVRSCLNQFTDVYGARFGCPGACQDPEPTAPGTFNVNLEAPTVTIASTTVQRASYCQSYIYDVTFTNQGSSIVELGNLTNLEARVFFADRSFFFNRWDPTEVDLVSMELVLPDGSTEPFAYTGGDDTPAAFDLDDLVDTNPDPDGAGVGLADLDGDGAFDDLPAGESVTLRLEAEYISEDCVSKSFGRIYTYFLYDTECRAGGGSELTAASDSYRNFINRGGESITPLALDGGPIEHEINWTGGTAREFFECFTPTGGTGSLTSPLTVIYELPDGVAWNGENIFYTRSYPTALSVTGDSLIATDVRSFDPLQNPRLLSAGFVADCSTLPPGTGRLTVRIPFTVIQTCETGCLPNTERILCDTLETTIICDPDPCLDPSCDGTPGMAPPTFQRTTLGYSDRVARTRFTDPSQLPTENLKRGTICDTLQMQSSLSYCGAGSADNVYVELSYDLYGGATRAFQPTVFSYYFEEADGSVTTGTLPAPAEVDFNGQHRITYDFTSVLPGGVFETGDSLAFTFDYYVLPSADGQIGNLLAAVPNLSAVAFSVPAAGDDASPGGALRSSCGGYPLDFSLHDVRTGATTGQNRLIGCQSRIVQRDLRSRGGANVDYYPDEVRPMNTVDSITIDYRNYYDPTASGPALRIQSASPAFNQTFPLTDTLSVSADGRIVTYDTRNLPLADFRSTNNGQGEYTLLVNLQSNCNSGGDIQSIFHYRKYNQTGAPACDTLSENRGQFVVFFPPSGDLLNITGPKTGDEEVECYDYRYENGIRTTNNVIIYSEEDGSVLEMVRVRDMTNGGASLPLLDYSGGHYVELAASIPAGEDINLEICVTASNCPVSDMLNIVVAYECTGFQSPDDLVTECSLDEAPLEMLPREAAIQVDFLTQPANPVTLCQPLTYDVRINSSQVANVLDPSITVRIPAGMELATAEVEYPIGSTNFEAVTLTNTTGDVLIDLGFHTGINDSLPGTGTAGAVNERQALARLTFLTSCDFASGDRIEIIPAGMNPCGGTARGTGDVARSNEVFIDGVTVPYAADVELNIGIDTIITCEAQTAAIEITYTDGNLSDGQPSAIDPATDSIEIFLPEGTELIANSFACTGADCPTITRTDESNNQIVLAYPAGGLSVPDGSSLNLNFSFDIRAAAGGDVVCEEANQLAVRAVNYVSGIACTSAPGGQCADALVSIVGQVDTALSVSRAQIINLMATATTLGTTNDFTGSFEVAGEAVPAGDDIIVEVYCSDGANGPMGSVIGTAIVAGPLAVGATPTFTGTAVGACNGELYFVIAPDTEAGDPQCVCTPEAVTVQADILCDVAVTTAVPTACDPADNNYDLTVSIIYSGEPVGSDFTITTSDGDSQTFTADASGSQMVTLTGLNSTGNTGVDVSVFFVDEDTCADTLLTAYNAPVACGWSSDPDRGTLLEAGDAVLTCGVFNVDDAVVALFEVRTPELTANSYALEGDGGYPIWERPIELHPAEWSFTNLGSVFGTAVDRERNIFVTATSTQVPTATVFGPTGTLVTINYQSNIGTIGLNGQPLSAASATQASGTIYKLDAATGTPTVFAQLPQQQITIDYQAGFQGVAINLTAGQRILGPGLGNIAYDDINRQFFVTNFEDGKIYRIDEDGTVETNPFDFGTADNGAAGMPPLGERVYGVAVYDNRVYYSVWTDVICPGGNCGSATLNPYPAQTNVPPSIRSVALDPVTGDFLPATDQLEWTGSGLTWTSPISDIDFNVVNPTNT